MLDLVLSGGHALTADKSYLLDIQTMHSKPDQLLYLLPEEYFKSTSAIAVPKGAPFARHFSYT